MLPTVGWNGATAALPGLGGKGPSKQCAPHPTQLFLLLWGS